MRFRRLLSQTVIFLLLAVFAAGVLLPSFARRGCCYVPYVMVYDVDGSLQCDSDHSPTALESAQYVGQVMYRLPLVVSSGWPATTSTTRSYWLSVHLDQPSGSAAVDASKTANVRQAAVSLLARDFSGRPGFNAARLAAGNYAVTTVHWPGYLINGLLYCVVLGALGLWCRRLVQARNADIQAARRAAGSTCTSCGYDLSGLLSRPCPECGASYPRTAPKD